MEPEPTPFTVERSERNKMVVTFMVVSCCSWWCNVFEQWIIIQKNEYFTQNSCRAKGSLIDLFSSSSQPAWLSRTNGSNFSTHDRDETKTATKKKDEKPTTGDVSKAKTSK
jgi:hypothetical protein